MNDPTITVVVPCHSHGRFLNEAIHSIIEQTRQPDQVLLLDDGSSDGTFSIMSCYAGRTGWEMISRPKASCVAEVLNRSIFKTTGDIWVWCPADDIFATDLLEKKMELSRQHAHKAIIYSDWEIVGPEGEHRDWRILPDRTEEQFQQCVWETSPIGFTGIWIPMTVFEQIGVFQSNSLSEDFQWMIRATIHKVPFLRCPHVLYKKRRNPQQTSAKKTDKILEMVPMLRQELREYQKNYERMQRP